MEETCSIQFYSLEVFVPMHAEARVRAHTFHSRIATLLKVLKG